jgi:hypothetical protein
LKQVLKSGGEEGSNIPRGGESGANNNARIPYFPAAIAMSGTLLDGHSFFARRLRWLRHSVGDENAASVCGAVGRLKKNPAFRTLKLDPQHSIDAILRK